MLCGILAPTSGGGCVGGFDIVQESESIKTVIGYMSQHFGLYHDLTVEENIDFYTGLYLRKRSEILQERERVIQEIGLKPYRKYLAKHLSGGWKQKLALASTISHRPKILFLDEPTAGIDPVSRRTLWDILYKLAQSGMTLFITTHYMEEAERCNRIGFIWNGKLVASDAPERIKSSVMRESLFSIQGEPMERCFDLLKGSSHVIDVNFYGDELHAVLPPGFDGIDLLKEELKEQGIQQVSIRQISPSIEDVFVSLSRQGG
jgi:ABC-2 type transport system ATP-binding protein